MAKGLPPAPTPRTADLPPEVNVVHVDDDSGFVDLASELLERADDRIDVRTVTDPEQVVAAIEESNVHCVVSDYDMPGMDGLELFDHLRDVGVELPFILFTGKGSETIAADAMTAGVTDYIQKGGMDTHEVVANRVLDAVKSRQRKKAVDRAINHYTALVEASHVPVYLYDDEGVIQYANKASENVFGVNDSDEIVGESFFDLLPEATHEEIRSRLSQLEAEEQVPETEFEFQNRNDDARRIRISCAPTPHHDDAVGQTIAHDVMRAEANRRELETFREVVQTALQEARAGLWVRDLRTDSFTRHGVSSLFGAESEDMDDDFDDVLPHVHPDDRDRLKTAHTMAIEDGESFCIDYRAGTNEKTIRHLEESGTVLTDENGTVTHVIGMIVDVTERGEKEAASRERDDQPDE